MRILFILLLILSSACFAKEKPLIVGTITFYPPFEVESDQTGNFTGFDVDLMNAICKKIKRSCVFKGMPFIEFMPHLEKGKIDLAIGAISITPKREQRFLFSLPYFPSSIVFISLAKSKYTKSGSIKGATIGMLSGDDTATVKEAHQVDQFRIKIYNLVTNMIQDLREKKIDLILTDSSSADYWVSANQNLFKIVGKKVTTGDGYGIMTLKKRHALITDINHALLKLEKDGTYMKIYQNYFQPAFP